MSMQSEANNITVVDTHIAEINPYYFRLIKREKRRINIFLPSINPEHVFGGISTALKFYEKVAAQCGYDRRIILVDAVPSPEAVKEYEQEYTFVSPDEESEASAQVVSYSGRKPAGIAVSEQDYFIFTGWWTAHCAHEAFAFLEKESGVKPNPLLYLIQDYEPGFYPWSTKYLLADATYKSDYRQIAIFNTTLLQEYFHKNDYTFFKEYAFEPVLNASLKERLYQIKNSITKKKQILIYGRPGTDRNAFSLIVEALKQWAPLQFDASEWKLLSAGELHAPIEIVNGMTLESVGKLSIDGYADVLQESYAGISLMASPHPSYPPLEMSVFGVKVITNTFANKDLKSFNDNIISLNAISPANIARHLEAICSAYKPSVEHKIVNQDYCENKDVFGFAADIQAILEEHK